MTTKTHTIRDELKDVEQAYYALRAQRDALLVASGKLADAAKRVITATSEDYRPELREALRQYEAARWRHY